MAEKEAGFMRDNELVAKINNEIDRGLSNNNKAAIRYLLGLPKKKEFRLFDVYSSAKTKYGLDEASKRLRFVVVVIKLACCPSPLVRELVKLDPSLKKANKFQLLKECLEDYDDDEDAREDLELKFKMRAALISLDDTLRSNDGHDRIFREHVCEKTKMSPEYENFEVFENLENRSEIGPNHMELITEVLKWDDNLKYARSHFEKLISEIQESNAVPATNQSQEATPAITPSTTTASSGTLSVLCTEPSDNSTISAPFVTLPRSNSEGHTGSNSKFVPGAPTVLQKMHQAHSHPPYNYSPRESPTLPSPSEVRPNPLEQHSPQCTKTDLSNPQSAVPEDHIISESAVKLREAYDKLLDIPTGDFFSLWPKVDRTRYVTLALVRNIGLTQADDFSHRTLRKSEDDIPRHKDAVTYEQIFVQKLPLILISGRPGAGKTVLLTKVAKDWASKTCLTDVKILLHVSLRELAHKSDLPRLEDVISLCLSGMENVRELAKSIDKANGLGVCFAFDGLDEYPSRENSTDFVMRVICKKFLPLATVIITSRPTASRYVPFQSRDLHVEIVGFMPKQIEEYVTDHYRSQSRPGEARDLLSYLDSHPNVKDMCYLPLHLAMILYINQYRGKNPLPETETDIYTLFISHSIIRYIMRERENNDDIAIDIRDFEDLERELKEEGEENLDLFHTICMIAFKTKLESHLIFDDNYLRKNFSDRFSNRSERRKLSKNGLGILSNYTKKVMTGQLPQYSFQHLTVQEFLGAYHLSKASPEESLKCIESNGRSSDLREFWRFFFGLTKSNPMSVAYFNMIMAANASQGSETLFLSRCLFEGQNSEFSSTNCSSFLASRKGRVDVSNIVLSSPDCAAIGYSVSQCPDDLKELVMNYCQVGPGGIEAMNYQMARVDALFTNAENMQVRSQFKPLGNEGGTPLTDILKRMKNLNQLRLYGNALENQKLLELQPVISPMTNLRILVLTKNQLGPKSGETIGAVVRDLRSLIQFYASYNPIGSEGLEALLPGIVNCKNLQRLGFRDCQLSSRSGRLLSEIIAQLPNLQQLELYLNKIGDDGIRDMIDSLKAAPKLEQLSFTQNGITDIGGCLLAELLEVTSSLRQMRLFYNEVSDVTRKAFYDAAQRRAQQGRHEVLYAI